MKHSSTRLIIYRMVITAIFIALCFVGTYIHIPVGISKMHLGNFVCIIAGLLCGGLIGGLSGSIGMGLNDIVSGYGPDTVIRTFIVKFAMGFLVGYIFRLFVRKKNNPNWIYSLIVLLFSTLFITFLILFINFGTEFKFGPNDKYTFKNSIFLIVCLGVIDLLFAVLFVLSNKINKLQQFVLISTSIALVINIILEFVLKIPLKMLFAEMTFEAAFLYATASLPGALLTTILTIALVTVIYCPVYYATEKINKLNDVYKDIQEITSTKVKKESVE